MMTRSSVARRLRRIDPVAVAMFGAPLMLGLVGTRFTVPNLGGWYRSLDRPSWTPPGAAFGPVWTTLYLLMGVAGTRVWLARDRRTGRPDVPVLGALALHAVQLQLNLAWSWLFFDRRRIDLALADILALDATVAATAVAFARVRPEAGALLLPYLAWSTFATVLNAELLRRNGRG
jgi:tryptophan-rich sensory protein